MTDRISRIARTLPVWSQAEAHTLQELEEHSVRIMHALSTALLSGLCQGTAQHPSPTVTCPCGDQARYVRMRSANVPTLLGSITYPCAYDLRPACGQFSVDTQLQACAGGFRAEVQDVLPLLGSTQDSLAQAASVLERHCLVQVCPNRVRAATEEVGQVLLSHNQAVIATAQTTHTPPATTAPIPDRLHVRMDVVVAHTRESHPHTIVSAGVPPMCLHASVPPWCHLPLRALCFPHISPIHVVCCIRKPRAPSSGGKRCWALPKCPATAARSHEQCG